MNNNFDIKYRSLYLYKKLQDPAIVYSDGIIEILNSAANKKIDKLKTLSNVYAFFISLSIYRAQKIYNDQELTDFASKLISYCHFKGDGEIKKSFEGIDKNINLYRSYLDKNKIREFIEAFADNLMAITIKYPKKSDNNLKELLSIYLSSRLTLISFIANSLTAIKGLVDNLLDKEFNPDYPEASPERSNDNFINQAEVIKINKDDKPVDKFSLAIFIIGGIIFCLVLIDIFN